MTKRRSWRPTRSTACDLPQMLLGTLHVGAVGLLDEADYRETRCFALPRQERYSQLAQLGGQFLLADQTGNLCSEGKGSNSRQVIRLCLPILCRLLPQARTGRTGSNTLWTSRETLGQLETTGATTKPGSRLHLTRIWGTMLLDSILLESDWPTMRKEIVTTIDGPLNQLLELHLKFERLAEHQTMILTGS